MSRWPKGSRTVTPEAVTDYIDEFISTRGYQPTRREIAGGFGVGLGTIQQALIEAIEAGLIESINDETGRSRALKIIRRRGQQMKSPQPRITQFGGN
jgi:SOS-response transcriptional repressor LexA